MVPTLEEARFLAGLVRRASGIALDASDVAFIEHRLEPVLRAEQLKCPGELVQRLSDPGADPALGRRVIHALATHDTRFFRNPEVFASLESNVLPAMFAALSPGESLRAWCAGCSTGQEPYSLAIAARDVGGPAAIRRVEILATDLSEESLAHAGEGVFSQYDVTRGMPDDRLHRHFRRTERHWRVEPELRSMLKFEAHNLCVDRVPGMFHLVFCRNVLMYFDPHTRARVLAILHRALFPGGWLFLGVDEAVPELEGLLEATSVPGTRGAYKAVAKSRDFRAA